MLLREKNKGLQNDELLLSHSWSQRSDIKYDNIFHSFSESTHFCDASSRSGQKEWNGKVISFQCIAQRGNSTDLSIRILVKDIGHLDDIRCSDSHEDQQLEHTLINMLP